jgi:hypothetical protein
VTLGEKNFFSFFFFSIKLSAMGTPESLTLIRNKKQETPLLGSRVVINGLVAKPELNGRKARR